MLRTASIIGFIPVRDMQEAEDFFAGRLGLAVVERGAFALVLGMENGQTLRCVPVPGATPQPFTIVGWEVADIHAAAMELRTAGVEPILYPHFEQDADGVWTAPGGDAQVLWFNDPSGNVLSLSEHLGKAQAR